MTVETEAPTFEVGQRVFVDFTSGYDPRSVYEHAPATVTRIDRSWATMYHLSLDSGRTERLGGAWLTAMTPEEEREVRERQAVKQLEHSLLMATDNLRRAVSTLPNLPSTHPIHGYERELRAAYSATVNLLGRKEATP